MLTSLLTLVLVIKSPFTWLAFFIGACVGSFLNVCILRIPEKTFWKHKRSVCPACDAQIPFYLNIPILAFFILRGRARCCGAPLSWQYPVVEFASAVTFAFLYWYFPFLGWQWANPQFDLDQMIRWIHACGFVSLMLTMSVIDIRLMIIPDVLSLGMLSLSPVIAWLHPDLTLMDSVLGAFIGGGVLYGVAWSYWLLRRQYGLGFGDVKLLAAIGGWLGWQAIFSTLFLGSIVGSIMSLGIMVAARRMSWQAKIPFGPFLALGAVAHLLFGSQILMLITGG